MTVIEIINRYNLYYHLTKAKKMIIFFYAVWSSDCNKFESRFLLASNNSSIVFCQVNVDKLLDIRRIYNVDTGRLPGVYFIKNNTVINVMYGYRPELFDSYMYDFVNT